MEAPETDRASDALRRGVSRGSAVAAVGVCVVALVVGLLARGALSSGREELVPLRAAATVAGADGSSSGPGVGAPAVTGAGAAPGDGAVSGGPVSDGAGIAGVGAAGVGVSGGAGAVLVHVVGAVRSPGVVTLVTGARVLDAVDAAGGATRRAALGLVNLARPVVDGEQLRVPARGETVAPVAAVGTAPPGGGAGAVPGTPIDLNTADASLLESLPGIGPVLAGRIVEWRTANGRFTAVEQLTEVSGIGDRVLEQVRALVTV